MAIAAVNPESPGAGVPQRRIEYGHRRIVGVDHVRTADPLDHQDIQRLEQISRVPRPPAERGTRQLHAGPSKDVFQPVERHVIAELAHRNLSQQARSRQAAVDWLGGQQPNVGRCRLRAGRWPSTTLPLCSRDRLPASAQKLKNRGQNAVDNAADTKVITSPDLGQDFSESDTARRG